MANSDLVERLELLFPLIDTLARYQTGRAARRLASRVHLRLGELQNVLDCIQGFGNIFTSIGGQLKSRDSDASGGVCKIKDHPTYLHLAKNCPAAQQIRACVSITIGVNLDASLRPVSGGTSFSQYEPFTDQSSLINYLGCEESSRYRTTPFCPAARR